MNRIDKVAPAYVIRSGREVGKGMYLTPEKTFRVDIQCADLFYYDADVLREGHRLPNDDWHAERVQSCVM